MTQWQGRKFSPIAWRGRDDVGTPQDKWSQDDEAAEFWAPPRGYAVYVPQ
jgi:alpha-amylase